MVGENAGIVPLLAGAVVLESRELVGMGGVPVAVNSWVGGVEVLPAYGVPEGVLGVRDGVGVEVPGAGVALAVAVMVSVVNIVVVVETVDVESEQAPDDRRLVFGIELEREVE